MLDLMLALRIAGLPLQVYQSLCTGGIEVAAMPSENPTVECG